MTTSSEHATTNGGLTLQPAGTTCECVADHRPPSIQFEYHHIWPKEYGGPSVPENMIYVCATTHNNIHCYLRAFVSAGRLLSPGETRDALGAWHYSPHVSDYAYDLAVEGWNQWKNGSL